MAIGTRGAITQDEFMCVLAKEFHGDGRYRPEDRLVEDLGFHSMSLLELVLFVEELATQPGIDSPSFPLLVTVSDAFVYYRELTLEHDDQGREPES